MVLLFRDIAIISFLFTLQNLGKDEYHVFGNFLIHNTIKKSKLSSVDIG